MTVKEGSKVFCTAWQMAEAKKVGGGLWKTLALPYRRFRYRGKIHNFDKKLAERVVQNFRGRAVPNVSVALVNEKNEHTDEPEYIRGRVVGLEAGEKGLYATCEMDARGQTLLANTPWIAASPYLHYNYVVEADNKRWGPTLIHLAITPRGHLPEAGGWEQVKLSERTTVIQLEPDELVLTAQEQGDDELTDAEVESYMKEHNIEDYGQAVRRVVAESGSQWLGVVRPPGVNIEQENRELEKALRDRGYEVD